MEVFPGFTTPIRHPWIDGHFKKSLLDNEFVLHISPPSNHPHTGHFWSIFCNCQSVRLSKSLKSLNLSSFVFPKSCLHKQEKYFNWCFFMCLSMLILSTKPVWLRFWIHQTIYFPIFPTWRVYSSNQNGIAV